MAKILWWSDAGCVTGFARATHGIADRLVTQYGHEVSALAVNYRGDYWPSPLHLYRPTTIKGSDIYGQSRIIEMLARTEPDVVVILNDPYIILRFLFNNKYDPDRILLGYRPLISYIPVDGTNQPKEWFDLLSKVTLPVAMSKWGQLNIPESRLVYHGVDTDLFWPVAFDRPITVSSGRTVSTKGECKEAFGYSRDDFLILRVDSNSARKDFAATWKALVPVMKRHPDIKTHFHCAPIDPNGIDIKAMLSRDLETKDRFFLPSGFDTFDGWSQPDLNALYNAADLFVSTSHGEGFGLTMAESLACGVPVVAQNVSAIPEVVGPGGVLIDPLGLVTVPSGQDLWMPDIPAFTEAVEHLYLTGGERRSLGKAGRAHVEASFSWDFATACFHEYVEELMSSTTGTSSSQ